MENSRKSLIFVIITQLIWSTNAAVANLMLFKYSVIQLLFFNSLAASIMLFIIITYQGKLQKLRSYTTRDNLRFLMMANFGILGYLLLLYTAYTLVDTQTVYILNRLWPMFMIIFSVPILKTKYTKTQTIGILLCVIGTLLVVPFTIYTDYSWKNILGIILGLLAASSYGMYSALGKKYNDDRYTSIFMYYLIVLVISGLILILTNREMPQVRLIDMAGFIWIGGFILALGDLFWFLSLKFGQISKMSSIVFLSPFIALLWIYLLLDESIKSTSLLGLSVILIGIALNQKDTTSIQTEMTFVS